MRKSVCVQLQCPPSQVDLIAASLCHGDGADYGDVVVWWVGFGDVPDEPFVAVGNAEQLKQGFEVGAMAGCLWPECADLLPQVVSAAAMAAGAIRWLPFHERLLELTPDSVEYTDPSIRIQRVNGGFESVTGISRDVAKGKTTAELFRAGTHSPEFYKRISDTLSRRDTWRGQMVGKRADGSLSFQQATLAPVMRGDKLEGYLAVKRDASRQDLARHAIGESQSHLRELAEESVTATFVFDVDGTVRDANDRASDLTGHPREQLIGSDMCALLGGSSADWLDWWGQLPEGSAQVRETTLRTATGWMEIELRAGRTDFSGVGFILALASDIRERKRNENELRDANERLTHLADSLDSQVRLRTKALDDALRSRHAIVDQMADGLLAVSMDGYIDTINRALSDLLNCESLRPGEPLAALPHRELVRMVERCLEDLSKEEQDLKLEEGGTVLVTVTPVFRDEGECMGCVAIARDVTTERELDQLKTDFMATVSHELRTPLTSVLGFAGLSLRKLEQDVVPAVDDGATRAARSLARVQRNLGIIVEESNRLSTLINDLLDMSKIEAGHMEWDMVAVNAVETTRRAAEAIEGLFIEPSVTFRLGLPEELPLVLADEEKLIQVLINLISNARKFTEAGEVTVEVVPLLDRVQWMVRDTGTGIPSESVNTVFDRFRQLGDTMTDKPRGTGLGLFICREVIRAHGGDIGVYSVENVGSTFWFWIPTLEQRLVPEPED